MKRKLFSFFLAGLCLSGTAANDKPHVKLTFFKPGIVRIVKYPVAMQNEPEKSSFTVIMKPENVNVSTLEEGGRTVYGTETLKISIDGNDGSLIFMTAKGDTLLREKGAATFRQHGTGVDKGRYEVAQSWLLDKKEPLFGLGQRKDNDLSVRGKHITLWNTNTYTTIPVIISGKGYGLFWDNMGRSFFDDDEAGTCFRSEVADLIDYYFVYRDGTTDGIIAGLRALTGKATMFPLWSMGYWQCRERYKTSDELVSVLDRYRSLHIPLDAIVQDWQYWGCDSNWNAMKFMNPYYINKVGDKKWQKYLPSDMKKLLPQGKPRLKSPDDMVKYVHNNNAHLMITIWTTFGPWTKQFAELKKINALLPFDTWPMNCGARPYDPFNPKARDIYWKYLSNLYDMGLDAWWTDSSEPDHHEKPGDDDYITFAGSWRSVKNAYAMVHNRGIYEHQRAIKGNAKRSLQMTRSGQIGIQHYGTFSWSGDILSTWEELRRQVPSGLDYVICGIPFWNTDIGGFFGWEYDNDVKNPALQELKVRWMQWGTFLPLMRNHCSSPTLNEIYEYGKPGDWAYDAQAEAIRLRYRLLPYIYSTQGDVVLNDGSMMRPLVMDFAFDEVATNLSDEYMFGRSILVKPITEPMYTWRGDDKKGHLIYPDVTKATAATKVYLPKGTVWYDFHTGDSISGGRYVIRPCPISEIPVYIKAGTILPWGPDVQYSGEKKWDDLELRIYPGADGRFTLYEDQGDGYEYEKGEYALTDFTWHDSTNTLTISKRRGYYPGMITSRRFNIVIISNLVGGGNDKSTALRTVEYNGEEISIKL